MSRLEQRSGPFDGNVSKLNGKNMHVGMYIKASFKCQDDDPWHNYLCKVVEKYRVLPRSVPPEALLEAKTIRWPSSIRPAESILNSIYFL